jgi:hypothetical protein
MIMIPLINGYSTHRKVSNINDETHFHDDYLRIAVVIIRPLALIVSVSVRQQLLPIYNCADGDAPRV